MWKKLPESFIRLEALEELYLDSNQLECLPDAIGNLINLKELDILENKIAELPKSFIKLKQLEIFHAEGTWTWEPFVLG